MFYVITILVDDEDDEEAVIEWYLRLCATKDGRLFSRVSSISVKEIVPKLIFSPNPNSSRYTNHASIERIHCI